MMMQQPKVLYYAKFEYDKKNRFKPDGTERKDPVYVMTKCRGYYPPMAHFVNKRGINKGKATMYLKQKRDEQPSNAPKMFLQSTGSLNFTGLKDCFTWSGTAYGYPNDMPTYSGKRIPNPFLNCKSDGYLFQFHQEDEVLVQNGFTIPSSFELLILGNAKPLMASYNQQLQLGLFDAVLNTCRASAISCADSDETEKG